MSLAVSGSCPLPLVAVGKAVRLEHVTGGASLQGQLAALGFVSGAEVKIVNRNLSGPLIVVLKTGKLVLGQSMAQHIWVR